MGKGDLAQRHLQAIQGLIEKLAQFLQRGGQIDQFQVAFVGR